MSLEQSIARSPRQDSLTSSAHSAVAETPLFYLRLPRLRSSASDASTAQSGRVRGDLHRPPPPPPVPAKLERPAIGGNRCQLLGKVVI